MNLVIFDLDGVILDTAELKLFTLKKVFDLFNLGRLPSNEKILSAKRPFKLLSLYTEDAKFISDVYGKIYDINLKDCRFFFQIDELIKFKSPTTKFALFTAQPKRRVELIFSKKELDFFEIVITEDDNVSHSKFNSNGIMKILKNTNPFKAILLSDAIDDLIEAKKFGITSIFTSWGYTNITKIKNEKPDYIFDSPLEIFTFLKTLSKIKI